MNSMPATIAMPSATASATAPSTLAHASPDGAAGTCRSIGLDIGNVLRIRDGRGLCVTPATGVLWITEENSTNDAVLLAGQTHRIAHSGLALVLAHRPSLVLLEVAAGAAPPRRVEFASNDGAPPGRRVLFGTPRLLLVRALAAGVRRLIRNAFSPNPTSAKLRRVRPTDDRAEHDMVHSSWLARPTRQGLGAHDPLPGSARAAMSRDLLFPYY